MLRQTILIFVNSLFIISCSATSQIQPSESDSLFIANQSYNEQLKQIISQNPSEKIWYVKAGSTGDGQSIKSPTGSFEVIMKKGSIGDTIIVLVSDKALEGGIELKDGQSLIGLSLTEQKPALTNKDSLRNEGCGIILANDNRVINLEVHDTQASGLYGIDKHNIYIKNVDVHTANLSQAFLKVKYPTLPGSLPHGGMFFINSTAISQVVIDSSTVKQAAGFGVVSITSSSAQNTLNISKSRIEGGTRIGFFDAGISVLVQDPSARAFLEVSDTHVHGRLSRSGRNIMVVASSGGQASTRFERIKSGATGQDGIVGAVMQSPSEIDILIKDSIIENAGQMNVEGSLINLKSEDPAFANKGRVSIHIENSIIRNAGAVAGFENVAANVWMGASQFLSDQPPAIGKYNLYIANSTIEDAGRSGLEFGDLEFLNQGQSEQSEYNILLRDNIIKNNGEADIMVFAPMAKIEAQRNCWGRPEGLLIQRILIKKPAQIAQINSKSPLTCKDDRVLN